MDKYDIFLCYRGEKGALLAHTIYSELGMLRKSGVNIFYAPKSLPKGERIEEVCAEIAGQVSLMILFITNGFFDEIMSKDDVVRQELKSALRNTECKFLPVLMDGFNFGDIDLTKYFADEDAHRIKGVNPIRYADVYSFESASLFIPICMSLAIDPNNINKSTKKVSKRTGISENKKGDFFSDSNRNEKERLVKQQQLMLDFDNPVYDKLLSGKKDIVVLDLGSGNGTTTYRRLGERPEIKMIIGIEYDETNVRNANEKYGSDRIKFYQGDIEDDLFGVRLVEIMEENKIDAFDFVNVIALLAHLRTPSKLFKLLKTYCNEGALLFVRNIDDGFNVAYPDDDGMFAHALSLMQVCPACGYRYSGRQVFTMLHKRGYKNIQLEKTGISTVELDVDQKEALFDVVFGFIRNGLIKTLEAEPDSNEIKSYFEWFKSKYEDLESAFMSNDFFFYLGFMIYTAQIL